MGTKIAKKQQANKFELKEINIRQIDYDYI